MCFGTQTGSQQEIRRVTKVAGSELLILDLLYVAHFMEDVWRNRTVAAWAGQTIPVVTAAGLAKLKKHAGRSQDLVDIQRLGFDPDDPTLATHIPPV